MKLNRHENGFEGQAKHCCFLTLKWRGGRDEDEKHRSLFWMCEKWHQAKPQVTGHRFLACFIIKLQPVLLPVLWNSLSLVTKAKIMKLPSLWTSKWNFSWKFNGKLKFKSSVDKVDRATNYNEVLTKNVQIAERFEIFLKISEINLLISDNKCTSNNNEATSTTAVILVKLFWSFSWILMQKKVSCSMFTFSCGTFYNFPFDFLSLSKPTTMMVAILPLAVSSNCKLPNLPSTVSILSAVFSSATALLLFLDLQSFLTGEKISLKRQQHDTCISNTCDWAELKGWIKAGKKGLWVLFPLSQPEDFPSFPSLKVKIHFVAKEDFKIQHVSRHKGRIGMEERFSLERNQDIKTPEDTLRKREIFDKLLLVARSFFVQN